MTVDEMLVILEQDNMIQGESVVGDLVGQTLVGAVFLEVDLRNVSFFGQ